jgi:hypothetical protein
LPDNARFVLNGAKCVGKPAVASKQEPLFKWETLRELGPWTLRYEQPVQGKVCQVELTSGPKVQVFRAEDRQFYFCHALTFGSKEAPGGAASPFSGQPGMSSATLIRSRSSAGNGRGELCHE